MMTACTSFLNLLKGLLQCLLRNHILAGTLQQQMAGFTDALRRHTERRAVLKEGVNSNLHLQLIGILCCDRGGLGQFCLRDMEGLGSNCVCCCLYGSAAPYIKGESFGILAQLVVLAEFGQ